MTDGNIQFNRTIPVRYEVDIFVAGGGPAGVAAALAATRQGKSVFIAEGQACFGGMGTSGLVPAFMRFTDGLNFLADGIGREIYDRMKQYADIIRLPQPRFAETDIGTLTERCASLFQKESVERCISWEWGVKEHFPLIQIEVKNHTHKAEQK